MNDEVQAQRINILLVDDRPGNLVSLQGILERADYNLVTAMSGEEALSLILRQEFALVLLDVAMPGMDGFEVATIIRQHDRFKTLPIIFVTASVNHLEWIFKAYSVGAVDFLLKPLDPHAVRAKVAVFAELHRQTEQAKRYAAQVKEFERREREREVARVRTEGEQRYRQLTEAIPHIVWTAAANGRIEHFNRRWSEVTGLPEQECLGNGWRAAVHPEDRGRLERAWGPAIAAGQAFEVELRLRRAEDRYHWYLCRALPERDAGVTVVGWVGTLTDVDKEKRAHEDLEATVRLRDEFISVASHELRTPLSTLQLQLQSVQRQWAQLKMEDVNGRLSRKLAIAAGQTDRLAKLIDSLLDVSRMAQGTLEVTLEEFDLAEAVRQVVERFRDDGERAGCEFRLSLSETFGNWDRLRTEQVITNLLANSLKYAPGSPITVSLELADGEWARLSVHDEGIGIEPGKVERIFERFERAVASHHYAGLGLGLYIVRQIVEAHGGRVGVSSRPGEGSTFTVDLPLRPPTSHGSHVSHGPALPPSATEHANDPAG